MDWLKKFVLIFGSVITLCMLRGCISEDTGMTVEIVSADGESYTFHNVEVYTATPKLVFNPLTQQLEESDTYTIYLKFTDGRNTTIENVKYYDIY